MNYIKELASCEAALEKAKQDNDQNTVNELSEELERIYGIISSANRTNRYPMYSEYFKKRLARINKELKKKIEETAKQASIYADEYGTYKPGVFTHKSCIVSVGYDDEIWSAHIYSDEVITDVLIKEIRYRFIPDDAVMARLYEKRSVMNSIKGVVLYQVPGEQEDKSEQ